MSNPYAAPNANSDEVLSGEGAITHGMLDALRGTRGWVKLIGILLLIAAAFSVLVPLATIAGATLGGGKNSSMPLAAAIGMSIAYLLFGLIYLFLGTYLLRYAGAIGRLLLNGEAQSMEEALQFQQKFWRLGGMMALISMVLVVVGIGAAIVIPLVARGV